MIVDLDDTIIKAHGCKKQGAGADVSATIGPRGFSDASGEAMRAGCAP